MVFLSLSRQTQEQSVKSQQDHLYPNSYATVTYDYLPVSLEALRGPTTKKKNDTVPESLFI
jgi:hypothetical protein